jgi:cysteine desulfurase
MARGRVYMDHSATTPLRAEVARAMAPHWKKDFGNASSLHAEGRRARAALEEARSTMARCIGARSDEVYFTSGGTESDNLALLGTARRWQPGDCHIVTSAVEHHAVLRTCEFLERKGYAVSYVPVGPSGRVRVDDVERRLLPETRLVSIMAANNEVGTLQPVAEIGEMLRGRGPVYHVDAVQALGKVEVDVKLWNADLVAFSGHKIHGPKGVGVLYVGESLELERLQHGGHHEGGLRPGTENVAGAVGMARAAELAVSELDDFRTRVGALRDELQNGILSHIPEVQINGDPDRRLPNILNASFRYVEGESLLLSLDSEGVAVATGSACTSGSAEPSHVLVAMGVEPALAHASIRFSLGRFNRPEHVERVLRVLPDLVRKLRVVSPLTPAELR